MIGSIFGRELSQQRGKMAWAATELQLQCDELTYGLRRVGTAAARGGAATIELVTLEDERVVLSMDEGGVRVVEGGSITPQTYDCVNTLMLHSSAAFKAAFNAKLFEQLAAVAAEREQEEAEEERQKQEG